MTSMTWRRIAERLPSPIIQDRPCAGALELSRDLADINIDLDWQERWLNVERYGGSREPDSNQTVYCRHAISRLRQRMAASSGIA
jgi:hypothetical protein